MDLLITAKKIADRVEAESLKQSVPVAVTVIDTHGNIVLVHRMTGAPAFSLELSERKAYTSALVGMRTADLVPLVQPGAELYPLLAVSGGRYSAMGGGVPLTSEDQVVAGVGVSGATTEQDIAIVEAAMSWIVGTEQVACQCRSTGFVVDPLGVAGDNSKAAHRMAGRDVAASVQPARRPVPRGRLRTVVVEHELVGGDDGSWRDLVLKRLGCVESDTAHHGIPPAAPCSTWRPRSRGALTGAALVLAIRGGWATNVHVGATVSQDRETRRLNRPQ